MCPDSAVPDGNTQPPAALGKAVALGEAAPKDSHELAGDGQFQRLAGPGLLDPESHPVQVCVAVNSAQSISHRSKVQGLAVDVVDDGIVGIRLGHHHERGMEEPPALGLDVAGTVHNPRFSHRAWLSSNQRIQPRSTGGTPMAAR